MSLGDRISTFAFEPPSLLSLCVDSILAAAPSTPVSWSGFLGSLAPAANAYADDENAEWANDLCHIVFETLLKFTLDNLGDHSAGISLSRRWMMS